MHGWIMDGWMEGLMHRYDKWMTIIILKYIVYQVIYFETKHLDSYHVINDNTYVVTYDMVLLIVYMHTQVYGVHDAWDR